MSRRVVITSSHGASTEWYLSSFRRYRDFVRGRARRTEFWTFTLMNTLILGLSLPIQFLVLADTITSITEYSTTGTIPIFGALMMLIMLCTDSDPGDNRFGLNPKAHPATAERRHVAAMG